MHFVATLQLAGTVFNWYDNNKDTLQSWRDLKHHLLERFKPSLSTAKMQLKEWKQQPSEPLITYDDGIIELCKQVNKNMHLNVCIDYLKDGLRQELKIHVERQLKTFNNTPASAMSLKIARDEEELQNEFSVEGQTTVSPPQPYFSQCVSVTGKSSNIFDTPTDGHKFLPRRLRNHRTRSSTPYQQYCSCLVNNRSNHRTVDRYNKKPNSCYKSGDLNHLCEVVHMAATLDSGTPNRVRLSLRTPNSLFFIRAQVNCMYTNILIDTEPSITIINRRSLQRKVEDKSLRHLLLSSFFSNKER